MLYTGGYNENREKISKNQIIGLSLSHLSKADYLNADSPFEWLAYKINMENKECAQIIFSDATCNGIQHIASLVLDSELGKDVNLLKAQADDKPRDIYNDYAKYLEKVLKMQYELHKKKFLKELLDLGLDRSLVKKCVMTLPYKSTKNGVGNQIKDNFIWDHTKEKFLHKTKKMYISKTAMTFLIDLVYNKFFIRYTKFNEFLNYLNSWVKITNKLNLGLS